MNKTVEYWQWNWVREVVVHSANMQINEHRIDFCFLKMSFPANFYTKYNLFCKIFSVLWTSHCSSGLIETQLKCHRDAGLSVHQTFHSTVSACRWCFISDTIYFALYLYLMYNISDSLINIFKNRTKHPFIHPALICTSQSCSLY